MKQLQRRTKRSAAVSATNTKAHAFSERMSSYQNMLSTRWQALPPRDQLALAILSVFCWCLSAVMVVIAFIKRQKRAKMIIRNKWLIILVAGASR